MKARGARTPRLGKRLKELRQARGPHASLDYVVHKLQDLGYDTDKSVLHKYENGRPPDFGLLIGLAIVYEYDFLSLCQQMAHELLPARVDAPNEAPLLPASDEALEVARAFDKGPEKLRTLIRNALSFSQEPGQEQIAQALDPRASPRNAGPARKQRR